MRNIKPMTFNLHNRFAGISLIASIFFAAGANASPELAKQNTCMGCHAMDRKVVGPSYKAIATRYQSQPRAQMVDTLANKIRLGGGGAWGVVVMPANTKISQADAKKLAEWILDSNK